MSLFHRNREPRFRDDFEGESGAGQPATGPLDRLRAQGQHPETFPALPGSPRDTGPMQRMPRITRIRQQPRPDRPYDAAIFIWSDLIEQFIMLCGTCPPKRRSRYADPIAATMPHGFEALRQSAYVMGWRLDAFARWACPACQAGPHYRAPYPVIHWDPDAAEAYLAGDEQGERRYRAQAELDLARDVASNAGNGRHRAGAR